MSKNDKSDDKEVKKGRGLVMKAVAALALIGVGGGGAAFAMMQTGMITHGPPEKNEPRLVYKGDEDPYAPAAKEEKGGPKFVFGEGGSEYRTAYYSFGEDFTSNLKNSDALVQVSLAASTQRDGRVLMWMKVHELAIRSAILAVLADTPEEQVYSIEGKDVLQSRLTSAINRELEEREGFGGIDKVYFRSFIVQ